MKYIILISALLLSACSGPRGDMGSYTSKLRYMSVRKIIRWGMSLNTHYIYSERANEVRFPPHLSCIYESTKE
ncbi:Uncharacterised protein [Salmonella enterica subsp. arizonae]|nr:Uncharacterised protein [Salmonella enterica subsp. arizonae]